MTWRFIDPFNRVVMRVLPNGAMESKLASELGQDDTPLPFVPPPEERPRQLTRYQFKAALEVQSLLAAANTAVSGLNARVKLAWSDAPFFSRGSAVVQAVATALNLTDGQVDGLFQQGSRINE